MGKLYFFYVDINRTKLFAERRFSFKRVLRSGGVNRRAASMAVLMGVSA